MLFGKVSKVTRYELEKARRLESAFRLASGHPECYRGISWHQMLHVMAEWFTKARRNTLNRLALRAEADGDTILAEQIRRVLLETDARYRNDEPARHNGCSTPNAAQGHYAPGVETPDELRRLARITG